MTGPRHITKPTTPAVRGGGGGEGDPLACFDGLEGIPTQETFGLVATLVPDPDLYPDSGMFGRDLAAELDRGTGDIVLAVGSRGPTRVHVFRLDPDDLQDSMNPVLYRGLEAVPVPNPPRRIVTAYFNDDNLPDFVVSGRGPVQALVSPGYVPVTLQDEGDGIAATNDYIAVGVEGAPNRSPGEVFFHRVDVPLPPPMQDPCVPSVSNACVSFEMMLASLSGPSKGSKFGDDVALGDFDGDEKLDLVVGASGAKPPDARKKDSNYGVALTYADVLNWGTGVELALGAKDEQLGREVEIAGQMIFVGTGWPENGDARVGVYPPGVLPKPIHVLRPAAGDLDIGWASGGISIGTIGSGGALSAIVGAPNGHCDGFDHSVGVAYLYEGLSETPQIFVPPHSDGDPIPADWNAFGWSADIITAGDSDFVIIGEPGFRGAGRTYVYRRPHP